MLFHLSLKSQGLFVSCHDKIHTHDRCAIVQVKSIQKNINCFSKSFTCGLMYELYPGKRCSQNGRRAAILHSVSKLENCLGTDQRPPCYKTFFSPFFLSP